MEDIDKALPNVETEIKVPGDEEVLEMEKETIEEQVGPDDIQVTQEEDGGATINFDPEAVNQPGTESHFDNFLKVLNLIFLKQIQVIILLSYLHDLRHLVD